MSNSGPGWWSDWFIALLIASGVLLIFNDGLALSILLWVLYLSNGWKTVQRIPTDENMAEWSKHLVIGIIVIVVSIVIKIAAHC